MAHRTLFKSDEPSRLQEKTARAREEERAWFALCRLVDARDGMKCRCCRRRLVQTLSLQPDRREHHHIVPVSLGGQDTKQNLITLCLGCHQDRHVRRTLSITGNAEQTVTFEQAGRIWHG